MQSEPLIINCCLTGVVPQKKDNPYVPINPDEIIQDAKQVISQGATVLHIHARDTNGVATYKKEIYAKIIKGIRSIDPLIIICTTTSGRVYKGFSKRSQVLELTGNEKPDFASLILGSMNFPNAGVLNDPKMITYLTKKMRENGIHPEWEVFEPGMLNYGKYLVSHGVLEEPRWINILLGNLGTSPATKDVLRLFVSMLPTNWRWAATGVGRFQLEVNTWAIESGGHVRVGLEDSFFMDNDKKELATNAKLVSRIVDIAKSNGRPIATPAQARKLLLE